MKPIPGVSVLGRGHRWQDRGVTAPDCGQSKRGLPSRASQRSGNFVRRHAGLCSPLPSWGPLPCPGLWLSSVYPLATRGHWPCPHNFVSGQGKPFK